LLARRLSRDGAAHPIGDILNRLQLIDVKAGALFLVRERARGESGLDVIRVGR